MNTRSRKSQQHSSETFTSPSQRNSTPLHNSEDQDEFASPVSSTSPLRRLNPSRTNKSGLLLSIQKQLLQEIEESGGIGDATAVPFNLSRICNNRTDVYGKAGSETRRRVRNKVYKWRQLDRAQYFELLATLGVQSGQRRRTPPREESFPRSPAFPSSPTESTSSIIVSPVSQPLFSPPAAQPTTAPFVLTNKKMAHQNLPPC